MDSATYAAASYSSELNDFLSMPLHEMDKIRYSHFDWEYWPTHPVPETERHVLRHLNQRIEQLEAEMNNASGEKRAKLEAEHDKVFELSCTLAEEWKTVDTSFDVLISSLSYLEEERKVRFIKYREYEQIMLVDIVPSAKTFVEALLGVLFRRSEACSGVLKGQREVLMTHYDFQQLMAMRDRLMANHPPMMTAPAMHDLLCREVHQFNHHIKYCVPR